MIKGKTSAELVKYLVEQLAECGAYKFADLDKQILIDYDLMLTAVSIEPDIFEHIDESLRGDLKIAEKAIAKNGYQIRFASDELKANGKLALATVSQDPFSLRYFAKELWSNEGLLNIAFGEYKKPSPDSCKELRDLVKKLSAFEIDKMVPGEIKEEFANLVSAYCFNVVEYLTEKNINGRRMFFTIVFQAEPINLVLNQTKNSKGVWVTSKCNFRDENGSDDIHDNGRIDELLGDPDFDDDEEEEDDE